MAALLDIVQVGTRGAGQITAGDAVAGWEVAVLARWGAQPSVKMTDVLANALLLTAATPPAGYTGFGDVVKVARNSDARINDATAPSLGAAIGPAELATTQFFLLNAAGVHVWIVAMQNGSGQDLLLAAEDEVTLA